MQTTSCDLQNLWLKWFRWFKWSKKNSQRLVCTSTFQKRNRWQLTATNPCLSMSKLEMLGLKCWPAVTPTSTWGGNSVVMWRKGALLTLLRVFRRRGVGSTSTRRSCWTKMCPSPSGWRCLMQWSPLLYYSVWWPCHLHNGSCSGWTAHRGVCWDQSLAGLATVQKTGVPTCGEWMKDWKQLWNFIQCNFGQTVCTWGNFGWRRRLLPKLISGRSWRLLGARWTIGSWTLWQNVAGVVVQVADGTIGCPISRPEAAKRRQQWVAEEQFFLNFCRSQWWISRCPMSF